jgi:hypothetical protein
MPTKSRACFPARAVSNTLLAMAQCTSCYKKLPLWNWQKMCRECRREREHDRARILYVQERSPWSSPTSLLIGANVAVFFGMVLAGVDLMAERC